MRPYWSDNTGNGTTTSTDIATRYKPINPTTFQIICAGQDGEFGHDRVRHRREVFPSGNNYIEADKDNITNFSGGKRSATASSNRGAGERNGGGIMVHQPSNFELEILNFRRRGAFTLMELLIVMMIMTLLAGLALSALAGATEAAREQRTRAIITKIDSAHHGALRILPHPPRPNAHSSRYKSTLCGSSAS